jgi:hypothetical protein
MVMIDWGISLNSKQEIIGSYLKSWCVRIDHEREKEQHSSLVDCIGIISKIKVHATNDDGYYCVANHTGYSWNIVVAQPLEASLDTQAELGPDGNVIGQSTLTESWLEWHDELIFVSLTGGYQWRRNIPFHSNQWVAQALVAAPERKGYAAMRQRILRRISGHGPQSLS